MGMRPILLAALLGSMAVGGCVIPAQPTQAFNDRDFQSFRGYGSAEISGHVFLDGGDDRVISGGGYQVELTPATPYTLERYSIAEKGRSIEPPDPGLSQYTRTTVTNYMGNFVFRGLPPGQYLLSCSLTWDVPAKFQANSVVPLTEQVLGTATVGAGESDRVTLTNPQ